MTDATAPASGETLTFGQTLKSSDFVGLGIKNGLLNMVTFGVYSFWAKTATRRSIWEKGWNCSSASCWARRCCSCRMWRWSS